MIMNSDGCFTVFLIAIIFLMGFGLGFTSAGYGIRPMDVYQGKTTLKYEIVDGVRVDSTVIWKEELK